MVGRMMGTCKEEGAVRKAMGSRLEGLGEDFGTLA